MVAWSRDMSNELASLLAELRTDHKNMSLMLDLLEHESNCLYDGKDADYETMHDVMSYMTVYPDVVHHPKEDRVYAELKAVRPDLSTGFDQITIDHRDLAVLGMQLRNDIESIMSGTALRRNVVVADALRYVKRLRDHMHWEECDLFLRVEEMMHDGHDLIIDSDNHDVQDPVFGPEVEQRFSRLFESIEETLHASHM
jgi:hemerythrin-like domain-containing protein